MLSIYTPCPKGRMRIYCSSYCQRHIGLLPLMDVIKMQDIKAMTILYPYYKNVSGGPERPNRWGKLLGPAHAASSMRVASPRALHAHIVASAPLDLLHVDFTSIETMSEPNQSPRAANVLVFQDHFMKQVLVYVTPDQTVRTLAKFLYGGYIPGQGLEW